MVAGATHTQSQRPRPARLTHSYRGSQMNRAAVRPANASKKKIARYRLLIEEWLPAQVIGIECMRENSTGLHPPPNRLHVWWARRPLAISRAAVLASLLPADFDRAQFERLLGFYAPSNQIL